MVLNMGTTSKEKICKALINKLNNYRPSAWAEGMIKLIQYYGTKIRFISMAAEGDIQILAKICKIHKLNFRSRVF